MFFEKFKGTGISADGRDACNCTCYTGGAQQSANLQVNNDPVCKCSGKEEKSADKTRKEKSTTQSAYDANNGDCWLVWG